MTAVTLVVTVDDQLITGGAAAATGPDIAAVGQVTADGKGYRRHCRTIAVASQQRALVIDISCHAAKAG